MSARNTYKHLIVKTRIYTLYSISMVLTYQNPLP
jgi:hypothetical protein